MITALQCLALFWIIPALAVYLIASVKLRRASARKLKSDSRAAGSIQTPGWWRHRGDM